MGNELSDDLREICKTCNRCKEPPETFWDKTPEEGCEIAGILFLKREDSMQKVRRAKEELLDIKVLKKKTNNLEKFAGYESYEKKLVSIIKKFEPYGSENW